MQIAALIIALTLSLLQQIQTAVGGGTPQSKALVYDASGNLVCDGPGTDALLYQYDAWNRLVQVNRRGTAVFNAKRGVQRQGRGHQRVIEAEMWLATRLSSIPPWGTRGSV